MGIDHAGIEIFAASLLADAGALFLIPALFR
jgi:hypothetical protein